MKKIIFLFLLELFFTKIVLAQDPYPIKEHYDRVYPYYYPTTPDYTDCKVTGNSLSWTLSGLLRMYQATGDKGYLIKFINHCVQIQNNRWDIRHPGYDPVWVKKESTGCDGDNTDDFEPAYFNSLLIYPMAEFVSMVINEPGHTLYNTNLPLQLINDLPHSPTILGYGDFANWLGKKVEETLMYMNTNYWDNSFGIKSHYNENCYSGAARTCGTVMNMNSPFGCTLLFMGLANTNFGYGNNRADYLYKAQFIASFYKGDVNIVDGCDCNLSGCSSYNYPVLRLMQNGNNSYFWYHAGWGLTKKNCLSHPFDPQPLISKYIEFTEDVTHGAMDLWFARACYEAQLAPCNTCTPYFTSTEMERFRNTLTKNIYYTDATGGGHFHNTVEGTDGGFSDNTCGSGCPTDLMWGEVLDWMPLYKFDGNSTPNAYDIILNHTKGVIHSAATFTLTGAQSFLGLSEVVKAQWDKECVNLTLYNRDVVYNQDFVVKNKLTIAPKQTDDNYVAGVYDPFAEPKIFTDNGAKDRFVVEPGLAVNFVAGEYVLFLPGVYMKSGSAYIAPNACSNGMRIANSNGGSENTHNSLSSDIPMETGVTVIGQQASAKSNSLFSLAADSLAIYPNPSNGSFTLSTTAEGEKNIFIYDAMGSLIFQKVKVNSKMQSVDIAEQPKGIYLVKVSVGDKTLTKKIIKE